MHEAKNSPGAERVAGPKQALAILLGSSLSIMGAVMVAPVLPKMASELVNSPETAMLLPLVATGPALAIALFAPLAGWLSDRIGRKTLLMLATLIYVIAGVAPALLHSLNEILGSRLIFGLAEAAIMTCCTTLIGDYWKGAQQQRYINLQVVAISLVGSLFFVLGGAAGELSWRAPFYLYLLPLLLLPLMAMTLWEPTRQPAQHQADTQVEMASATAPGVAAPVLSAGLLALIGMIGSFIVPVQTPGLLVHIGVTSTTLIGASAGTGLLATLAGSMLWPLAYRQLGRRLTNSLLLILLAVGLLSLATAHSYAQVLVAVSIHGIGGGLLVPNALAGLLPKLSARARARGVGVFTACLYLGQFASPLLIGALAGPGQQIPAAINMFAYVLIGTAVAWAMLAASRREQATPAQA
ncbi:MFS transporter [Uliginosibacterium sediminicola]|uniref:MFS-type drug efflux transporter P55 n=1 Tax=Uliginosibacterium sediminicola TaxID=2024550 RepID=A0ABU9YXC6_9RHOO